MSKDEHLVWYLLICALASRSTIVSIVFSVLLFIHFFQMSRDSKTEEKSDD